MTFDMKEYQRLWYQKNKDKVDIKNKEWAENNKEKIKEHRHKCDKIRDKNPDRLKKAIIRTWKNRNVICEDYEKLHTKWFNTNNCEWCNKDVSKRRYIEHNHYSGEVRGIVCQSCNNKIATKDKRYKEVMISIKSIKT